VEEKREMSTSRLLGGGLRSSLVAAAAVATFAVLLYHGLRENASEQKRERLSPLDPSSYSRPGRQD